jgi:response regulator RpfG family c-di-GMP phosphodiesterase
MATMTELLNDSTIDLSYEATRRPRIMVIDDERRSVELLERTLRRMGFVTTAASGEEAIERMAEDPPDLVITDQRMPGIAGSELLARVAERWPRCARILLTGYSDLEATIRAINEGGVHAYVSKPWKPDHLVAVARGLLERVELERINDRLLRQLSERNEELEIAMSRLRKANTLLMSKRGASAGIEPLRDLISHDVLRDSTELATYLRKTAGEVGSIDNAQLRERIDHAARDLQRMARSASEFLDLLDATDSEPPL